MPPTTPYIVTSGTLSAFSSSPNVPSTEQSYTVSGGNLTGNIVITAPADFQISTTSGSGFGSTVNLTPIGGTVSSTPIYVRFLRSTLGTSTGNITHTSAGATTRNVAVSGTAVNRAPAVTLVQPVDDATGVEHSADPAGHGHRSGRGYDECQLLRPRRGRAARAKTSRSS